MAKFDKAYILELSRELGFNPLETTSDKNTIEKLYNFVLAQTSKLEGEDLLRYLANKMRNKLFISCFIPSHLKELKEQVPTATDSIFRILFGKLKHAEQNDIKSKILKIIIENSVSIQHVFQYKENLKFFGHLFDNKTFAYIAGQHGLKYIPQILFDKYIVGNTEFGRMYFKEVWSNFSTTDQQDGNIKTLFDQDPNLPVSILNTRGCDGICRLGLRQYMAKCFRDADKVSQDMSVDVVDMKHIGVKILQCFIDKEDLYDADWLITAYEFRHLIPKEQIDKILEMVGDDNIMRPHARGYRILFPETITSHKLWQQTFEQVDYMSMSTVNSYRTIYHEIGDVILYGSFGAAHGYIKPKAMNVLKSWKDNPYIDVDKLHEMYINASIKHNYSFDRYVNVAETKHVSNKLIKHLGVNSPNLIKVLSDRLPDLFETE